jgi:antibiotic biosynthesis monooxygenase (ABM) superfamily enzyme
MKKTMKNTMITELIKFELLQTTTEEQLFAVAEKINGFLQKLDGFIDSELIKPLEGNIWYFIYHIENMEKLKVVGEKIRSIKLFNELIPLITTGSMVVTFFNRVKKW